MSETSGLRYLKQKLPTKINHLLFLTCLLVIGYYIYDWHAINKNAEIQSTLMIIAPEVNDIYFLDLRSKDGKLDHKNKYRLAKVVALRGRNVTIVYGNYFYQWQYAMVNSIQYGDLSNNDYFSQGLHILSLTQIKEMHNTGEIYLVERPKQNKLYGNFVSRI